MNPADILADAVSEERLEADLRVLTGVDPVGDGTYIRSRAVEHADLAVAADWIVDQLDGWDVTTEPFTVGGVQVWNIVAELPAREESAWVVLGAHYDSTASDTAGWDAEADAAPGADDDGSGTIALIETARVLGGWDPGFAHPLRLVFFSAEETGLDGSFFHVEHLQDPVELMVQLDPVGRQDGSSDVFVVWDERWPEAADALAATGDALATSLHLLPVPAATIQGDPYSDHFPFWLYGLPAIHVSAPFDPALNHTVDDTIDGVDLAFVAEVTRLTAAHAARLAGAYDEEEAPIAQAPCACTNGGGPLVGLGMLAWLARRRR